MATKTTLKPRKTKLKAKQGATYVAIILDSSSSIDHYRLTQNVVEYYNQFVKDLQETAKKTGQKTYLSVYTFSDDVVRLSEYVPVEQALDLDYSPYGNTAMIDGLGVALTDTDRMPQTKDAAYLLVLISDGEENRSTKYKYNIGSLINQHIAKGNYTIAVQVPQSQSSLVRGLGIPADCIRVWDVSKKGLEENTSANTVGLCSYMRARAVGTKSVQNFYNVDVDLHNLKPTDVKRKCDDVTNVFKEYKVEKEIDISTFYEEKTGQLYAPGEVYYQITKPEKLQSYKNLVVQKTGEKTLWGGDGARDLLGIPDGKDVKLNPINLSYFTVFAESTSTNRKLVRGTRVLFRK